MGAVKSSGAGRCARESCLRGAVLSGDFERGA
jgi:hypothetical protein